uniref:UPAR/Ly6 domain-containing protein n=1 Tax=Cyprinus carpio TaxID=7962 RepID=A0A8C1VYQ5_CYPCA
MSVFVLVCETRPLPVYTIVFRDRVYSWWKTHSHFLGGKTIRRCIRYTDCDNSRLSQKFPSISEYTYRCCNTDLCNSGPATAASMWTLSLLAVLTGLWSCFITA